jgi:hypothetical protein
MGEPVSEKAFQVLRLLRDLQPGQALTGRKICDALAEKNVFVDESVLTTRIIPALRRYGVKNKPRIGYYLSCPP